MLATLTSVKADRVTAEFAIRTRWVFLFCKREKQFSIESIIRKLYLIVLPKVVYHNVWNIFFSG